MPQQDPQRLRNRRKGQTLAEFGLTLPILLLLVFGVIEFGRIFQAWVTIQNSARETTRYLTTGQFDEEKYDLDTIMPCSQPVTPDPVIAYPGNADISVHALQIGPGIYDYSGENLFATWYGGQDCDPGRADHEQMRKDILRVVSAYDVARRSAAGLALEDSPIDGDPTMNSDVAEYLFRDFYPEPPRSDQSGYFHMTVCSTRAMLDPLSVPLHDEPAYDRRRFVMIDESDDLPLAYAEDYSPPFCMLNEVPTDPDPLDSFDPLDNSGHRFMDAGGPGDRIDVLISFNHPLITPLPLLADYLTITARRSGVNEAFVTTDALASLGGGSIPPPEGVRPTPVPPTETATATDTPTSTATTTATNTSTFTPTPGPFECANLQFSRIFYTGNQVYVDIINHNREDTPADRPVLKWVELSWRRPAGWDSMFLQASSLDTNQGNIPHYFGSRSVAPFLMADPAANPATDLTAGEVDFWNDADRSLPGNSELSAWIGTFMNLPFGSLGKTPGNPDGLTEFDLAGSKWIFTNPDTGEDCVVEAPIPDPTNPTEEPTIDISASDTFTPDCASELLSISFNRFDTFGVVVLTVENRSHRPSPWNGFDLYWPDHTVLPKVASPTLLGLDRITVGGSSANDPSGFVAWTGGPDYDSNTDSTDAADGTWNDGYIFPPLSSTNIYLDYSGTGGRLDQVFDVGAWMFSGAFNIGCYDHNNNDIGRGGPGGGGGGAGAGIINLAVPTAPGPTNTPRPTNTPGPTLTPSPTRPTNTPSNTPTPGPTKTFTLTPEPTATTEEPPPDVPTDDTGSGGIG